MSRNWYYADRNRQQQGPVNGDALAAAFGRGEVEMSTLVWHEQLPQWVPLQQVAAELGLRAPPPPMTATREGRPRVVKPKSTGRAGWIIAIVVILLGLLFVVGILAAIALPAYSDYTTRSRVSQAIFPVGLLRTQVAEYHISNNKCPRNGDDGFGTPQSFATQYVESTTFASTSAGCTIVTRLQNLGNAKLEGSEFTYTMDSEQNWIFSSNIPDRYLPVSMRSGSR